MEVAALETARGGILRSGLGWDRSTVSVVLNIASDHLGLGGVNTLDKLARVKRVIVESVTRDGYAVLNADGERVARMASKCPGKVIFFSMDPVNPVITSQLAEGGRAAYYEDGKLIFAEGSDEFALMSAKEIPATHGGVIPFQVQNALAAAAACWGAGVAPAQIRLGLRTFQSDDKMAPGRFNLFDLGECKVIVDYGHNPHALKAMQGAVQMMNPRRSIGVITSPGDRRDEDMRELARVAADTFDWVIVREDDDLRGREPGEVTHIISSEITLCNPSLPVYVIPDEGEAVEQALEMARPGDLVVILSDRLDETLTQVRDAAEAAKQPPQHFTLGIPVFQHFESNQ